MGTLTGTTIINGPDGVREQLIDARKVTWSDATLLHALSQAQRTISFWKADAYPKTAHLEMVQGTTQVLPADGIALLDIQQNLYSGLRVTQVDGEMLDETNRYWPVTDQRRDVFHFAADPRTPRYFSITPPNDGTGEVFAFYCAIPVDMVAMSDTISLLDTYEYVLKLLTMSEAYRKNSLRQDLQKSGALIQEARVSLGIKAQSQVVVAPKVTVSEGQA